MIKKSLKIKERIRARKFALQALYQYQFNPINILKLQKQFIENNPKIKSDWIFFCKLTSGVYSSYKELDKIINFHLLRPFNMVDPIELNLLRLGTFELKYCIENPYPVILNEYVKLSVIFAGTGANRFINSILDKIAKSLRKN